VTYSGRDAYGRDRDDVLDTGPDRPARRSWLTPALLALVVIAAGAVALSRSGAGGGSHPHPHPQPRLPPVSVRTLGRPLLGVRASWQLFARGPDSMIAIGLAAGRITTTPVPDLESNSPEVAFLVGAHEAIIRSFDQVPGYVIADGDEPRPLSGILAQYEPGVLLPGPRPGQTWVMGGTVHFPALLLIGADGRPTGTSARLPPGDANLATAVPDGRGNALVLDSNNDAYDASAGRYWRVRATVLAVGPVSWLGFACRGDRCRDVVIDAVTGAQHALPRGGPVVPVFAWPALGATSPDGRFAAVPSAGGMSPVLRLVNLGTGASVPVSLPLAPSPETQDMVWSPDSRWLFVAGTDGKLMAVSSATGKVTGLGVPLPAVSQVAVRAPAGSGP
jgi:energy-converting hydrogenase Eha subunit A